MTASTEQERALANLRHLYKQMVNGAVKDSAQARRIAEMLLSPAIAKIEQAARRAPVVPRGWRLVQHKAHREVLDAIDLLVDNNRAFDDSEAFWDYLLAAAPQPPACNPSMQPLPELATKPTTDQLHELLRKLRVSAKRDGELGRDSARTEEIEREVMQLLAAQEQSHGQQT